MRCPVSETTKLALARTLKWTLLEFENAVAEKDAGKIGRRRKQEAS